MTPSAVWSEALARMSFVFWTHSSQDVVLSWTEVELGPDSKQQKANDKSQMSTIEEMRLKRSRLGRHAQYSGLSTLAKSQIVQDISPV